MGFFSNIGKAISGTVSKIGKTVASGVTTIGKGVLNVGRTASHVLDTGINTVKTVVGEAMDVPLVGTALKAISETKAGQEVLRAFQGAEDVNKALKETVAIGTEIEHFIERVSGLSAEDLKDHNKRKEIADGIVNISNKISNSKIGQKLGSLPEVKKQVNKFNSFSNSIQKKIGPEYTQRIKADLRRIV